MPKERGLSRRGTWTVSVFAQGARTNPTGPNPTPPQCMPLTHREGKGGSPKVGNKGQPGKPSETHGEDRMYIKVQRGTGEKPTTIIVSKRTAMKELMKPRKEAIQGGILDPKRAETGAELRPGRNQEQEKNPARGVQTNLRGRAPLPPSSHPSPKEGGKEKTPRG